MKRVLVITSKLFPPSLDPMGQRPRMAKYLPLHGWQPIILTPRVKGRCVDEIKDYEVVETDYDDFRTISWFRSGERVYGHTGTSQSEDSRLSGPRGKEPSRSLRQSLRRRIRTLVSYPDPRLLAWYRFAVREAVAVLQQRHVDAIYTLAKPFSTHMIGRRLKALTGVPWAADFADLWTQNKHYDRDHGRLYKAFDRRVELWTLRTVDAMTTGTEPMVRKLQTLHGPKPAVAIPMGYDPDDFDWPGRRPAKKFTIAYTGSQRVGEVDPEVLFRTLAGLLAGGQVERQRLAVKFFGPVTSKLQRDVVRYGLQDVVQVTGWRVSREIVLREQMQATLLLVLAWQDADYSGVITSKLCEYLGARRPILALGREGLQDAIEDTIERTQTGLYVKSEQVLRDALWQYYHEFERTGAVRYGGIPAQVEKFSKLEMARLLANALDAATSQFG